MGCDYHLFCQVFDFSFFTLVLCPMIPFFISGLNVIFLNTCSRVSPSLVMLIILSTSQGVGLFSYTWIWNCLKHILHSIDFFKVIISLSSLQVPYCGLAIS